MGEVAKFFKLLTTACQFFFSLLYGFRNPLFKLLVRKVRPILSVCNKGYKSLH